MDQIATGYGLIEGPVWDKLHGLYFSDVLNGGVFRLDRGGKIVPVIPERRLIGGMALHEQGGLVVGGFEIDWVSLKDGTTKTLLKTDATPGGIGFNDFTADALGRIYVGSLAWWVFGNDPPKPGHLHVIDLDGSMRTLSDGVMLTNGMGFSADGKLLYHNDSVSKLVRVYDVKPDGSVGPWRTFATLSGEGVPDGLKVASDGSVWVAMAYGGRVVVFNPDGSHRKEIAVPLPMVTSLCFGGDDLRDLYVVTGSVGGPSENCGTLFHMRADVAGLPVPTAKVKL
jgi:gluconolactonase